MKLQDISLRKSHYRTHFGPEPENEEAKKQRLKQRANVYKESLVNQIKVIFMCTQTITTDE